jgi:leader peptidase (prepilin peptidase) / N-methyltransferase
VLDLLARSPDAFIAFAFAIGLLVGSFLNVVIYRLPVMLERRWHAECAQLRAPTSSSADTPAAEAPFNLVVPRSACPGCHVPISSLHNVPVLSWLWLRGRCASCGIRISARYPAVEMLCAIATALVAWRFGFGWPAACAIVVSWFLIALTFIDLDHQLLPDSLTLPLLWMGLLASLTGWASGNQSLPVTPVSAIGGAVIGYLCLWSVYHGFRLLTGKEGMGYGDFKLLAALGAWLGWQMLLPIVLLSACVGAIVGIALILLRRQHRGTPMPFGPFLATAGWVAMLWGPQIVTRYLGLYAPRVG